MAVTLYRQVGKGGNRRYKKVNLGPGRRPADLAVPISSGIRFRTEPARGSRSATTSMRQSRHRSRSKRILTLWQRMSQLLKTSRT